MVRFNRCPPCLPVRLPVVEEVVEVVGEADAEVLELALAHGRLGGAGGDAARLDGGHDGALVLRAAAAVLGGVEGATVEGEGDAQADVLHVRVIRLL